MTTLARIGLLAFVGVLALSLVGCKKKTTCSSSNSACGVFQACCSSTDCYYTYNGSKYPCDGTDCRAAAERLASAMCGSAARPAGAPLSSTERAALDATIRVLVSDKPCVTCP
jgi:hypothetical protein